MFNSYVVSVPERGVMAMNNECLSCGDGAIKKILHLGPMPPSNCYLVGIEESCDTHPLEFGYCSSCGLAQLVNAMSPETVRAHFDWISYNEPEGHLDDLVKMLGETTGDLPYTRIVGLTYKDDSTLSRFNKKGIEATYRLKKAEDLGITEPLASLETIQGALTPGTARNIASRIDQADILLVRHILEHAHQPRRLLEACRNMVKPGGLMVFEVPDCRKALNGHDHCFLWEEHISYFTPETLKVFFDCAGFREVDIKIYPYPMEDSLIAIVRNLRSEPQKIHIDVVSEISRLEGFASTFLSRGLRIKQHLQLLQEIGKSTALFGAGHLAAKFINFYDLSPCLHSVIDDNPNKIGRFMPGSKVRIINSRCLDSGEVDLCLLTLNPESTQKVIKAKAGYLSQGGKFRSIFSASENCIDQDIRDD
jgi:SAM-dependent methyltransferase